jgi:hypothetical protein
LRKSDIFAAPRDEKSIRFKQKSVHFPWFFPFPYRKSVHLSIRTLSSGLTAGSISCPLLLSLLRTLAARCAATAAFSAAAL